MFRAVGSFLGRVFGSSENVGKTADMIRDGLDKVIYTEEERADYSQQSVELYLEFLRLQTDGGHLARRFLAVAVGSLWSLAVLILIVATIFSGWFPAAAAISTSVLAVTPIINTPFITVMTFYFGHRILQAFGKSDK